LALQTLLEMSDGDGGIDGEHHHLTQIGDGDTSACWPPRSLKSPGDTAALCRSGQTVPGPPTAGGLVERQEPDSGPPNAVDRVRADQAAAQANTLVPATVRTPALYADVEVRPGGDNRYQALITYSAAWQLAFLKAGRHLAHAASKTASVTPKTLFWADSHLSTTRSIAHG
jgi:hypothetical protein